MYRLIGVLNEEYNLAFLNSLQLGEFQYIQSRNQKEPQQCALRRRGLTKGSDICIFRSRVSSQIAMPRSRVWR